MVSQFKTGGEVARVGRPASAKRPAPHTRPAMKTTGRSGGAALKLAPKPVDSSWEEF
jgi:hypothetical protein